MQRFLYFTAFIFSAFISLPLQAETPNLNPGLWSHKSVTTIKGPIEIAPQNHTHEQCVTQADLEQGLEALDIPENCNVTHADLRRDRVDYAANCNMQGSTTEFEGHATFDGDQMQGQLASEMQTPIGVMIMQIDYQAERVGECQ